MSNARSVAVPWYSREDYPRIIAVMDDAASLAPTYDGWLVAAQSNEAEARRAGVEVVRVALDSETFTRWCADRGSSRTRAARVAFVNEAMRRDAGDE